MDLRVSPAGDLIAVVLTTGTRLYNTGGDYLRTLPIASNSFGNAAFSPDGRLLAVPLANGYSDQGISVGPVDGSSPPLYIPVNLPDLPNPIPAGSAFDPSGSSLYLALNRQNIIVKLDLASRSVAARADVGEAPFGVALSPAGDRLFVSNWGGPRPGKNQSIGQSAGNSILVDARGIASAGSVSVVDVKSFKTVAEIPAGLHPSGIAVSCDNRFVAVANANSDSVTLIDASSLSVAATINLPAFPAGFSGSSPTELAFSPDSAWLYVACAGNNTVALLESDGTSYTLRAQVPVDWYPIAVGVSAAGGAETVFVANSKGIGSRAESPNFRAKAFTGSLNLFSGRTADESVTTSAAEANTPFINSTQSGDSPADLSQLGIRHVFYIIKENRTYDQVLGDLGVGNGAPNLAIYGANVTPNQHALARDFVTLDNFYASGTVSADGHQWLTQSMTTDYVERQLGYARSAADEGNDVMAFASSGFLWNNALSHGLTARVFGEMTLPVRSYPNTWAEYFADSVAHQMTLAPAVRSAITSLDPLVERNYPGWALNVPDSFRARLFTDRLSQYEANGDLPNLVVIYLPEDHTAGASPGYPTPAAMVADNDLATGRILGAITRSYYWPSSAVFVTEDDAQDGVDHVDGHRTLCFVASPYVRRGVVDSTLYNHTSLVRTIEEILGLPPMNKFDASALPMRSVFTNSPVWDQFTAVMANVPLDRMNPAPSTLRGKARGAALASLQMDFSKPDAAPEEKLNRILWHTAKGWNRHYPRVPHRFGCKPADTD